MRLSGRSSIPASSFIADNMKKVNLPEPAPSSTTYRGSDASMGNFASECIQSRKKAEENFGVRTPNKRVAGDEMWDYSLAPRLHTLTIIKRHHQFPQDTI
mmetsp:Transcript_8469/g.28987  ORF Transcript_8469/g.28987 Transcript_8469/m.28987 type:complete len:100 (-) Transcript_8469:116-415(-)